MAAPVRSRRWITQGRPPGVFFALVVVPAGRTAIIREVVVYNATGTTAVGVVMVRSSGGTEVQVARSSMLSDTILTLKGAFVLEPADELRIYVSGSAGTFAGYAAGSLLVGSPS